MIDIHKLQKRFGRLQALDSLDIRIGAGQVTAVLGPNGAGKTTLIKSVLGLVRPDAGEIRIRGELINGDPGYRRAIGYMPQVPRYPENLTVREIIAMIKDLRGGGGELDEELIELFALRAQYEKPFRTLSGGNRQRVSAAIAFLFRPEILILDEPTAGLDPLASSTLKDKIRRERLAGRTVILTSHVMSEIEELADTIVYLLDGKVYFQESLPALLQRTGEPNLERALARVMLRVAA
jgi:Cu-processing system ATP-binding protein